MADAHAKQHDYHLVDPSPWPVVASISALVTTGGAVMWFHGGTVWVMVVGLLMLAYMFFSWWKDVINEGEHKGDHTPVVQLGLRYGMALFIASEVMFLVAMPRCFRRRRSAACGRRKASRRWIPGTCLSSTR
jgi:cytochrome c oxidase subunit 3